jgi:hypothetical protein
MNPAHSLFEFAFFFLVQPNCEVEKPKIERGLLQINITGVQIAKVPIEPNLPDCCAEHLSRIADLED